MVELDSSNLYENGKRILELVNELENNIDYIFNRMDGMPTITGEWQGKAAMNFLKNARKDKKQYNNLINVLRSYGNSLVNQAEKINNCTKKVEL